VIIALVVVAHAASGANWVLTSVLLQKRTADRYRGRVFATEWLLLMVPETLSIIAAALLLETGWLDLRMAMQVFAGIQILCWMAWLLLVVPRERQWVRTNEAQIRPLAAEGRPRADAPF